MEFEAVVERAPTNDYALFCLGRALLSWAARRRPASRSRWPRSCGPNAATTASIGSARRGKAA